jgi:ubiquinone/menaquinone biosynthesis C-methylase UbiE
MSPHERAKELYDIWHGQQNTDPTISAAWHKLARKYLDPARDISGKAVLEIGCGRGEFACWLAAVSPPPRRLVAADFSTAALDKARSLAQQLGITSISWERGDIQSLEQENTSFDTVISCETIEHTSHPVLAVKELCRVLKPGGRLILTSPNYFGTFGLYRGYLRCVGRRYTEAGQPINRFLMLPLTRRWMRREGLMIRVIDSVGVYWFVPGRHPLQIKLPEKLDFLLRWFGLQSCIVAEKPLA